MNTYTIADDKKLNGFFHNVVTALVKNGAHLHPPNLSIRERRNCPWCQNRFRVANWYSLILLTSCFWGSGPEVDDRWKQGARVAGFNADNLHETMLGAFVGGTP